MKKIYSVAILMIVFNKGYSQVWGDSSRTEIRNDAGLQGNAGAKSGFFQTINPINYPKPALAWWHLLDVRHSNPVNNFAMQFAGEFFDQDLYFRKVDNNPAQPWSRILTEDPDGDVGIGTTDPIYPLHIKASQGFLLNLENSGSFSGLRMQASSSSKAVGMYLISDAFQNNSLRIARYGSSPTAWEANPIIFGLNAPNASLVLSDAGYLGIGTSYPTEKLAVNGNIKAKKIIVTISGWADYVFEPSYKLPALDSVAAFIGKNKHLPEIPSASTIEKDGQDVGEIQKQLLKKIEELTLYVIEQNRQILQLQKEVSEIRSTK